MGYNLVLESIGFAGTHTITKILNDLDDVKASHGSRNFEKNTSIGICDVTPGELANQILTSDKSFNYAVHTNNAPSMLHEACQEKGIDYKLLVREPVAQINSCYKWAAKKLLQGDVSMMQKVIENQAKFILPNNLPATAPNALFFYALLHVLNYNLTAISLGIDVIKTEDVLNSAESFANTFKLPLNIIEKHPYFCQEKFIISSHSNNIGNNILAPIQENSLFINILNSIEFDYKNTKLTLQGYRELVGY